MEVKKMTVEQVANVKRRFHITDDELPEFLEMINHNPKEFDLKTIREWIQKQRDKFSDDFPIQFIGSTKTTNAYEGLIDFDGVIYSKFAFDAVLATTARKNHVLTGTVELYYRGKDQATMKRFQNNLPFVFYHGKETYEEFKKYLYESIKEINRFYRTKKIVVDGKEIKIQPILVADYQCLVILKGMNQVYKHNSAYRCAWCLVPNDQLDDYSKNSWPMRDAATDPDCAAGVVNESLLNMKPIHCVVCSLHLTMNTCRQMVKRTGLIMVETIQTKRIKESQQKIVVHSADIRKTKTAIRTLQNGKLTNSTKKLFELADGGSAAKNKSLAMWKGRHAANEGELETLRENLATYQRYKDQEETILGNLKKEEKKSSNIKERFEAFVNALRTIGVKIRYVSKDYDIDGLIEKTTMNYSDTIQIINLFGEFRESMKKLGMPAQIIKRVNILWKQYRFLVSIIQDSKRTITEKAYLQISRMFGQNYVTLFGEVSTSYIHALVYHIGKFLEVYGCIDGLANFGIENRHKLIKLFIKHSNKRIGTKTFMANLLIDTSLEKPKRQRNKAKTSNKTTPYTRNWLDIYVKQDLFTPKVVF
eukprot:gene3969-4594_t